MHARERAEHRQRAGDVVAVSHVGHAQARKRAAGLAQREQVGERLAGMVAGGEHVDDGDGAVGGELLQRRVGAGAHAHDRATWRESTSAVSRRASPRESCSSSERSTSGCPPSSWTPTSKDTRVRVEGFWKISATLRAGQRSARPAARA